MPTKLADFDPPSFVQFAATPAMALEPDLARQLALVISGWAFVEHEMTRFASTHLLRSEYSAAAEFIIAHDAKRRFALMKQSAALVMPSQDSALVARVVAFLQQVRDERNQCVHSLWGSLVRRGTMERVEGAVALVNAKHLAKEQAKTSALPEGLEKLLRILEPIPDALVYTSEDFDDLQSRITSGHHYVLGLIQVLYEGNPASDGLRAWLDRELPPL